MEYRKANPEEREEYLALANYVFSQAGEEHHFESLIPKVYGEGIDSSSFHHLAVDESGKLHAQVAVLPQNLNVCGYQLKTGYIGTVCVHPESRGKGHMTKLMNTCMAQISETCDMAVLSGQRQRYEYYGFTKGGIEIKYLLEMANVRHALKAVNTEGYYFLPLFDIEGAHQFAYQLNESRMAYIKREKQNMPSILKSFGEVAVGIMKEQQLIGYLLVNTSGDTILEIGLEQGRDVDKLIKAYMEKYQQKRVIIHVPAYDVAINKCISRYAENYTIESSAMYQILNYAKVLEAFLTLKAQTEKLSSGTFSAVFEGQPITIIIEEGKVVIEQRAESNAVNYNKEEAQELLLSMQGRFVDNNAPLGWFPLPIFWYTADKF